MARAKRTPKRSPRPKPADAPEPGMQIEWRALDAVRPYPGNPKEHSPAQIGKIAAMIQRVGWRQPIVVDDESVIIAGHGRYAAAQQLALAAVPVHVAHGLSEADKRAYRIADNRLAEEAKWSRELLKLELDGLKAAQPDYDLSLTGFSAVQLKRHLGDQTQWKNVGDIGADEHIVLLECVDEAQAQALYEEMQTRGIACKLMS